MQPATTLQELAEAASYLCSASEELGSAGYETWANEVKQLLDILAAEIAWLQEQHVKDVA